MNRYYNTPYQYNNSQTAETKMLHASLMIFDSRGKLIQDLGLKLEDVKLPALEQTADFVFYKDIVALAYKKEVEVRVTVGKPDGTMASDTVFTKLADPEEIVRKNSDVAGNIRHWYKNVLYTWGFQNIRQISRNVEDPSRYVYYINKVEIR